MLDANELLNASRSIREHCRIHGYKEPSAVLISRYLNIAADMLEQAANGTLVELRVGTWIPAKSATSVKCSACNKYYSHESSYCPGCGALMLMNNEDNNDL